MFLSHTGRDGAKDILARPTKWFLEEVCKVKAFLDDGDTKWGDDVYDTVGKAAYKCTHALVLLSSSFRTRRYCVLELNSFLHCRRTEGTRSFCLLPALWDTRMENTNIGDNRLNLQGIVHIRHDTNNPACYLLETLWPRLVRKLGQPEIQPW